MWLLQGDHESVYRCIITVATRLTDAVVMEP